MANNGSYITKPVRQIADIKTVLGESVSGLGQLCTSGNVNMWAKYKPVRSNKKTELSDSDRAAVNYGFSWTRYATTTAFLNGVASLGQGVLAWTYNKPRGKSSSEYFRRLDFAGYQHAAVCPETFGPSANGVYAIDPPPVLHNSSRPQPAYGNIAISDLSLGNLNLAYRNGTSGTPYTLENVSAGTYLPYIGTGTMQYGLYYKSGSYYIPAPYPFFTLTVESFYGVSFGTKRVIASTTGCGFSVTLVNKGRTRTLNAVSLHRRKSGNYSLNSDGHTYNITTYASGVTTDYEQDINVGVSADYADSDLSVNLGNTSQERTYQFTVNPYGNSGAFFIRVQYTYETGVGSGTATKDMYLPLSVTLPANPT